MRLENAEAVEDFLENDPFRRWVIGERPQDKVYWTEWLAKNPEKRKLYQTAVALLLTLEGKPDELSDETLAGQVSLLNQRFLEPELPVGRLGLRQIFLKAAAVLLLGLGVAWLVKNGPIFGLNPKSKTEVPHTLVATRNREQKKVLLEDGSVVWLNDASTLRYPTHFAGKSREVVLEGEAYFEVQKDSKRPFVVQSGTIQTRVLGTSFDVQAYQDNRAMRVTVIKGSVEVKAKDSNETITLIPNQQAVYTNADRSLIRESNLNGKDAIGWHAGKLRFRDVSFLEAIATLQRSYDVRITMDESIKDCLVYADFDKKEDIEAILNMLLLSLDGKVTHMSGTVYHLSGRSCS